METKSFISSDDALLFAKNLHDADNCVDVVDVGDGTICVRWIKNKKFIAYDGKEFTDEVWMTEKEELICVQDLSEAHAKNIIRMMLRNDRVSDELATRLVEQLSELASVVDKLDENTESAPHILH